MPYFHVQTSTTQTETFVIEADNEKAAEEKAVTWDSDFPPNARQFVRTNKTTTRAVETQTAAKDDMLVALKEQ
jgi:hypothetical protein